MKAISLRPIIRILRVVLVVWGVVALVPIILAFTSYPGRMSQWLATDSARLRDKPEFIVLLGGAGIPSNSGLMRTFCAAEEARRYPDATVIVVLPSDPKKKDSDIDRMKNELVMRGVASGRILLESQGRNTREQALQVARVLGQRFADRRLLTVTSPYHLKRALLTFRKAGFRQVAGVGAVEQTQPVEVRYKSKELGGKRIPLAPDMGQSTFMRYGFWHNVETEVTFASELSALSYYWGRGWI
jgi:uncharacterized SAM-binding protein YcdF (DUF218 family)